MIQIRYVKTIVGYFNLYMVNGDPQPPVTVPPAKMSELFPEISKKAKFGCGEICAIQVAQLFGQAFKEGRIA
jgi:hypothetical protein